MFFSIPPENVTKHEVFWRFQKVQKQNVGLEYWVTSEANNKSNHNNFIYKNIRIVSHI